MSFNGGYESDSTVTVVNATESLAGIARIGKQPEVNAGINDTIIVTPLKLKELLNQTLRYQLAAGANSIIPKNGVNNVATAAFGTVLSGQRNTANAPYAIAVGLFAEALTFNEFAKSAGAFQNVKGSAQSSQINLFGVIPASSGSVWAVVPDGTGATGTANKWSPANNSVIAFKAQFTVTQNLGAIGEMGNSWTGQYEGAIKNVDGVVTWLGGLPALRETRQDAAFTPTTGFVIIENEIAAFVTGMELRTLHANISIQLTQTKFGLGG
jgi:hypothetical protein